MEYPIVLIKETDGRYTVEVPDLPGCVTFGDNMKHALAMAREAIVGHIQALADTQQAIPDPQPMEAHVGSKTFKGGVWAIISISDDDIPGKSVRVSITMPESSLPVIDGFARRIGENRSSFLVKAALDYVQTHGGAMLKTRSKPRGRGRPVQIRIKRTND